MSVSPTDRQAAVQLTGRSVPIGAADQTQGTTQLLGDGGFENSTWSPWQTSGAPSLDTSVRHSGARAAHLGNTDSANDQVLQTISIPTNVSAVTLDFWYRLNTNETDPNCDYFLVGLWDQSGATNYVLLAADFGQAGNVEWAHETYTLSAAQVVSVTGKTVVFGVLVQTDTSLTSRAWADDVAVNVTTAGGEAVHYVFLPLVARPPAGSPPVITSFSANPASIAPGGSSTLSWSVTGATSLSITPGIGTVTGSSKLVSPPATTEYTLVATNANGSTSAKTTVTVATSGGGAAFWLPYTSVTNDLLSTYGTSVAVDSAGGIHVGYTIYVGTDGNQRPAYYAYCPASCTSQSSWTRLRVSDYVQDVRLALDSAGHPRMMLYTSNDPGLGTDEHAYEYAACNGSCTNIANWTLTPVVVVNEIPGRRSYQNNRYFAIDPQDGPAFVYTDGAGTSYAHCSLACASAANWSSVSLMTGQYFRKASLAFTPSGRPRIAADYFTWDEGYQVYVTNLLYMGCDSACDTSSNWSGLYVYRSIGDAYFSLLLDTQGRPRLALYTGDSVSPPLQPFRLHYAWCNTACFDANASDWNQTTLGLPENYGEGADLVLDAQNQPRLAYELGGTGLGYASCNSNCESVNSIWNTSNREATSVIIAQYPSFPPYSCPIQTWFNGKRPSLALDPAGNPRIGYDAEHWWGGYDQFGNWSDIDVPMASFTLFTQPQ